MNFWNVANVVALSLLLWVNALMVSIPYIDGLSRRKSLSTNALIGLGILLVLSAISFFLVQVGSFTDRGMLGMFDTSFMHFIWSGSIGTFVKVQISIALLWLGWCWVGNQNFKWVIYAVVLFALATSYLTFGHGSEAAWWQKGLFLGHIFIALLWVGSLIPLAQSTSLLSIDDLKPLMISFGKHMSYAVPVLLMGGLILYRTVSGRWIPEPFVNAYDVIFILKLVSVLLLLMLAAVHKLMFVPSLRDQTDVRRLRMSIWAETAVATGVLVFAVGLSNLYAPT